MSLDRIVERLFGTPGEKLPADQLGQQLHQALNEELLTNIEAEGMRVIRIRDDQEAKETNKLKFKVIDGVKIMKSLPFGTTQSSGTGPLLNKSGHVLRPQWRFIRDYAEWEEALDCIFVVPAAPLVPDPTWKLPEPRKKYIKYFHPALIKYDVNYQSDPDLADRGRIRFPDLCVAEKIGKTRTASPPPRRDDPNNLFEENRRRMMGLRPYGPNNKAGYPECRPYKRDLRWESMLNDPEVLTPWEDPPAGNKFAGHKRGNSPPSGNQFERPRWGNGQEHGGVASSSSGTRNREHAGVSASTYGRHGEPRGRHGEEYN